jgi:DNA primase
VSAAARLLDRLGRVRQTGTGRWIAACPAHQDSSPSLSIRELEGDRVLVHCFGACSTGDVLAALGLSMGDLFDKPLEHHAAPSKSRIPARDVLELVSHEIDVAVIVMAEVLDGARASDIAWERLAQAAQRIGVARDHVLG